MEERSPPQYLFGFPDSIGAIDHIKRLAWMSFFEIWVLVSCTRSFFFFFFSKYVRLVFILKYIYILRQRKWENK
jgi:hypothetical protein